MKKILGAVLATLVAVVALAVLPAPAAQATVWDSVSRTDPSGDVRSATDDITAVRYAHEVIGGKQYLTIRIRVRGQVQHGSTYYIDYTLPSGRSVELSLSYAYGSGKALIWGTRAGGGGFYCGCSVSGSYTHVATARVPWGHLNGTHTAGGPSHIKIGRTTTWQRDSVAAAGYLY